MKARAKSTTSRSRPGRSARGTALPSKHAPDNDQLLLSTFPTSLEWIGLLGRGDQVVGVYIGHSSSKSIQNTVSKKGHVARLENWDPALRALFEAYAEGEVVDFSQVSIELPVMTPFRRQIIAATRRLAYGETASYGELARRVGHPRAARAVGTAMACNQFPILIPCHRVLAAGGKIGGYSAARGIAFKQQLLEMESRHRRFAGATAP